MEAPHRRSRGGGALRGGLGVSSQARQGQPAPWTLQGPCTTLAFPAGPVWEEWGQVLRLLPGVLAVGRVLLAQSPVTPLPCPQACTVHLGDSSKQGTTLGDDDNI